MLVYLFVCQVSQFQGMVPMKKMIKCIVLVYISTESHSKPKIDQRTQLYLKCISLLIEMKLQASASFFLFLQNQRTYLPNKPLPLPLPLPLVEQLTFDQWEQLPVSKSYVDDAAVKTITAKTIASGMVTSQPNRIFPRALPLIFPPPCVNF